MLSNVAIPLEEHPFLKELNVNHLKYISECASEVNLEAGTYLFRVGEKAEHLYLIHHGKLAVELNVGGRENLIIQTIGDGAVVGWSWLFPPYQWHFDARVMEPTYAICLDANYLRLKCEEDHDFGYELLKYISQIIFERLMSTRLQLINIYDLY
jgi:CRP-like cAMP-binding protein